MPKVSSIGPVGTQVRHIRSGREGTVCRINQRHNGVRVRWDGPPVNQFDQPEVDVFPFYLEPTDPEAAKKFEAKWPGFARRDRDKLRQERSNV